MRDTKKINWNHRFSRALFEVVGSIVDHGDVESCKDQEGKAETCLLPVVIQSKEATATTAKYQICEWQTGRYDM